MFSDIQTLPLTQQLERKGMAESLQLGEQRGIDRNSVMKMTSLSEDDLPQSRH